ncbi:MAG: patatin-like phospholipase family protein [Burkholderiaceae bacterium]
MATKPKQATAAAAKSSEVNGRKRINVALQGGGAHGAFSWGVLDKILEDGRLDIEGISGCSAGSMNAVVYAYGQLKGADGARQALHDFWKAVSDAGQRFAIKPTPIEKMMGLNIGKSMVDSSMRMMSKMMSPYQVNPKNANPLIDILSQQVDFDELRKSSTTKLFLSATNVRTGKVKVFDSHEVTAQAVMASACLPELFHAVEIDGEFYWDGGYMGNPVLYPLFYHTDSSDVVIIHVNPIERAAPPKTALEISNRLNEITFNSALMKELRAIGFVQKLMDEGWIKDEYKEKMKYVLMHSLRAENALSDLSAESKMESDWGFLTMLRDRGRTYATEWLNENYDDIGKRSTVDVKKAFL